MEYETIKHNFSSVTDGDYSKSDSVTAVNLLKQYNGITGKALTVENIFDLLQQWGGDPIYTGFGILSATICHNPPGEGSRKLYYYENTGLFKCFTGCNEYFCSSNLINIFSYSSISSSNNSIVRL